MAGSFNKVLLMGNLTRDPEMRHLPNSNTAVTKFGLAVNRRFRTADGEQREEVTFVDCDAFGRTAEMMSQYLKKGRPVFIEGHLRLDTWEKDGQKQSKLKVVVDSFQFIDSKPGGGDGEGGGGGPSRSSGSSYGGGGNRPAPRSAPQQNNNNYEPVSEDDIPF
jgi:single-strand DNA-binding protein